MSLTAQQVQKLYIAYFGRAADPSGFEYWKNSEWTYEQAANRFAFEPESLNRYEYLDKYKNDPGSITEADKEEFVTEVYRHLFNREPEPSGLEYWMGRLDDLGEPDALVVMMLEGAMNDDALIIANKVEVAQCYTDAAADGDIEYGEGSVSAGIIEDVDETDASVEEAKEIIEQLPGTIIPLTEQQDFVTIENPFAQDTVVGIIDIDVTGLQVGIYGTGEGTGEIIPPIFPGADVSAADIGGFSFGVWTENNSTFSIGDVILGNGMTKVEVLMDVDAEFLGEEIPWGGLFSIDADYVQMEGVDELELVAANDGGAVDFDASSYGDDISKVSMTGKNGMSADVENLQADETLMVELDTNGSNYRGGSELDVEGEWNGLEFDVELENGEDAPVGASHVELTEEVIDVNAAPGEDVEVDLDIGLEGDPFTGSGDAVTGNVVLGDIDMSAGKSGEFNVNVYNVAYGEDYNTSDNNAIAGDITIGNVSMDIAQYAVWNDFGVYHEAFGEDGDGEVGDLVMGDVDIVVADHASFEFDIDQYAKGEDGKDESDATIGTLTVGDISVELGDSAGQIEEDDDGNEIEIERIANAADYPSNITYYSSWSGSGDATIGDATFGDISVVGGANVYDMNFSLDEYAKAAEGDASIGDAVFGNVTYTFGPAAEDDDDQDIEFDVERTAFAGTGDATVGSVSFIDSITEELAVIPGNVQMTGGNGREMDFDVEQKAHSDEGNASTGGILVGDVTITVGDDLTEENVVPVHDELSEAEAEVEVEQFVYAYSGDATVGGVDMGDISLTAGDNAVAEALLRQEGWGDTAGEDDEANVLLEDMTVGDISLVTEDGVHQSEAMAELTVIREGLIQGDGTIDLGNTTLGDVTVGGNAGAYADFYLSVSGAEYQNMYYSHYSYTYTYSAYDTYTSAREGVVVGDVSIGDISMYVGEGGTLDLDHYIWGGDVGDVTYGDLSIDVAGGGTLEDLGIWVWAEKEDIGDFEMGDIDIVLGDNVSVSLSSYSSAFIWLTAADDIESITVGDVSITVGENVSLGDTSLSYTNAFFIGGSAGDDIGSVEIGDITLNAAGDDSTINAYVWLTAEDQIATEDGEEVEIGNVSLSAATSDFVYLSIWFSAPTWATSPEVQIGEVSVGNVAISAQGLDSFAAAEYYAGGYYSLAEKVDDVEFGNISLDVSGPGAVGSFFASNWADDEVGAFTIGNIDLNVGNTPIPASPSVTSAAVANVRVDQYGDLTVGDITLTQGISAPFTVSYSAYRMDAYVTLNAYDGGDLVIGDITVTGGYGTTLGGTLENYQSFSWLATTGDTVTVGDIDYSGYMRDTLIDLDALGWDGAAVIDAAQGDTTIILNDSQNTVNLNLGDDIVEVAENAVDPTGEASIDVITNFGADGTDVIRVDLTGSSNLLNWTASSYTDFLNEADGADVDIFSATVGGDTYVAFDTDSDDNVDFAIKLDGVTSVSISDFAII